MKVTHTLKPIYDKDSKILILGSIPSVKSREIGFYYGHPKNRFWSTLEKVFEEEITSTIEDKKEFLKRHHIALYDVIKECEISSSSDSSIKNAIPNDITPILKKAKIKFILTTPTKAHQLYQKYLYQETKIEDIPLPSTSPANCKKGIEKILIEKYRQIKEKLEEKDNTN